MFKTVGSAAIISYNNRYIFEIQKIHKWQYKNSGGIEIGVGCIGGTIEKDESSIGTLHREVKEEIRSEIDIIEWNQPFTVSSELEVSNIKSPPEKNLFFEWYGTKNPYKKCRICVFQGEVKGNPFPGDLPALLVTDIDLLIEGIKNQFSIEECLNKGMEIISREPIPLKATIKGTGTIKIIEELYKNHKTRLNHLL